MLVVAEFLEAWFTLPHSTYVCFPPNVARNCSTNKLKILWNHESFFNSTRNL